MEAQTKWKKCSKNSNIPQGALDFYKEAVMNTPTGKGSGYARFCEAYYKGDINTTKDWIIVMDDGGYYKVDAEFMTWHRIDDVNSSYNGKIVGKCNWSVAALNRTISAIKKGEPVPRDPGYQT